MTEPQTRPAYSADGSTLGGGVTSVRPAPRPSEPPAEAFARGESLRSPGVPRPSEPPAPGGQRRSLWRIETQEIPPVELGGLTRAVDLLATGQLPVGPIVELLRREIESVRLAALRLENLAASLTVDLRQSSELAERDRQESEEQRHFLREENDRFLAQLMEENERCLRYVTEEREAALALVRDVSRSEMTSPPALTGPPPVVSAPTAHSDLVGAARQRIDELVMERERSIAMLRRVSEQRDELQRKLDTLAQVAPPSARVIGSVSEQRPGEPLSARSAIAEALIPLLLQSPSEAMSRSMTPKLPRRRSLPAPPVLELELDPPTPPTLRNPGAGNPSSDTLPSAPNRAQPAAAAKPTETPGAARKFLRKPALSQPSLGAYSMSTRDVLQAETVVVQRDVKKPK